MLALVQIIALMATTTFTGAAIYITFVEHPARMACAPELAATVWAPSYKRASLMQAPLAVIGFLGGALAWWLASGVAWLIAGLFILAVVPFTLLIIGPLVNAPLHAVDPRQHPDKARALLVTWGRMHAARSVLGVIASVIMTWQTVNF